MTPPEPSHKRSSRPDLRAPGRLLRTPPGVGSAPPGPNKPSAGQIPRARGSPGAAERPHRGAARSRSAQSPRPPALPGSPRAPRSLTPPRGRSAPCPGGLAPRRGRARPAAAPRSCRTRVRRAARHGRQGATRHQGNRRRPMGSAGRAEGAGPRPKHGRAQAYPDDAVRHDGWRECAAERGGGRASAGGGPWALGEARGVCPKGQTSYCCFSLTMQCLRKGAPYGQVPCAALPPSLRSETGRGPV